MVLGLPSAFFPGISFQETIKTPGETICRFLKEQWLNRMDKESIPRMVVFLQELCCLMEAGGRRIEEYDAYASLCQRLDCDARVGLTRKEPRASIRAHRKKPTKRAIGECLSHKT